MSQTIDTEIQEIDSVILVHDLSAHHLKQGHQGAVVHMVEQS